VRNLPEANQLTPAVEILQQGQTLGSIKLSYLVAQMEYDDTHTSSKGLPVQRSPTHGSGEHYNALRDRSSPLRTYFVGLLNICHVAKYPHNDKKCSKSSIISNIPSNLCQGLAEEGLDRETCDGGMKHTYSVLSRLSISAYLSGSLMTFLALAIGIRLIIYCKGGTLAVLSTLVCNYVLLVIQMIDNSTVRIHFNITCCGMFNSTIRRANGDNKQLISDRPNRHNLWRTISGFVVCSRAFYCDSNNMVDSILLLLHLSWA